MRGQKLLDFLQCLDLVSLVLIRGPSDFTLLDYFFYDSVDSSRFYFPFEKLEITKYYLSRFNKLIMGTITVVARVCY
eukprot:snap_masked-scaffold_41-processed-gene-0.18-mRNA-1 protein AED:1.00 eAED:1.00 QI:0/0/0/0/1/1/2/0/76